MLLTFSNDFKPVHVGYWSDLAGRGVLMGKYVYTGAQIFTKVMICKLWSLILKECYFAATLCNQIAAASCRYQLSWLWRWWVSAFLTDTSTLSTGTNTGTGFITSTAMEAGSTSVTNQGVNTDDTRPLQRAQARIRALIQARCDYYYRHRYGFSNRYRYQVRYGYRHWDRDSHRHRDDTNMDTGFAAGTGTVTSTNTISGIIIDTDTSTDTGTETNTNTDTDFAMDTGTETVFGTEISPVLRQSPASNMVMAQTDTKTDTGSLRIPALRQSPTLRQSATLRWLSAPRLIPTQIWGSLRILALRQSPILRRYRHRDGDWHQHQCRASAGKPLCWR